MCWIAIIFLLISLYSVMGGQGITHPWERITGFVGEVASWANPYSIESLLLEKRDKAWSMGSMLPSLCYCTLGVIRRDMVRIIFLS